MLAPNLNNGGRWDHIASDAEINRAMRDKNAIIIEAPMINITFILSRAYLTTIRAGAAGGDIFSIEGGWVYPHDLAQRLDEQEIRHIADLSPIEYAKRLNA